MFGSSPTPTRQQARPETYRKTETVIQLDDVRGGEGGGREAESYGCKKAWPSTNHSIISAIDQEKAKFCNVRKTNIFKCEYSISSLIFIVSPYL
jgi:hypothetical protein